MDAKLDDQAEIERQAELLVVRLTPEVRRALEILGAALHEDHPSLPAESGLYALVAPDGVMVRVVATATATQEQVKLWVMRDLAQRMMREEHRKNAERKLDFETVIGDLIMKCARLKKEYRLEKLK